MIDIFIDVFLRSQGLPGVINSAPTSDYFEFIFNSLKSCSSLSLRRTFITVFSLRPYSSMNWLINLNGGLHWEFSKFEINWAVTPVAIPTSAWERWSFFRSFLRYLHIGYSTLRIKFYLLQFCAKSCCSSYNHFFGVKKGGDEPLGNFHAKPGGGPFFN